LKSEQEKLTRDKVIDRLETERDDWKREAFTARKAEIEKKETREANDFLTNLTQKLDKKIEQTQKKYHPLNNHA
jgi:flagellar biosynthesis chaperone FliJ